MDAMLSRGSGGRIKCRMAVLYRKRDSGWFRWGEARNMSLGGMLMESEGRLETGETIILCFRGMQENKECLLCGTVVRARRDESGGVPLYHAGIEINGGFNEGTVQQWKYRGMP